MVRDRDGEKVSIGDSVKILSIDASVLEQLKASERDQVESMVGEVLKVYEIDEYGQAWVEKWWKAESNESTSHSVGLNSINMQLVKNDR